MSDNTKPPPLQPILPLHECRAMCIRLDENSADPAYDLGRDITADDLCYLTGDESPELAARLTPERRAMLDAAAEDDHYLIHRVMVRFFACYGEEHTQGMLALRDDDVDGIDIDSDDAFMAIVGADGKEIVKDEPVRRCRMVIAWDNRREDAFQHCPEGTDIAEWLKDRHGENDPTISNIEFWAPRCFEMLTAVGLVDSNYGDRDEYIVQVWNGTTWVNDLGPQMDHLISHR